MAHSAKQRLLRMVANCSTSGGVTTSGNSSAMKPHNRADCPRNCTASKNRSLANRKKNRARSGSARAFTLTTHTLPAWTACAGLNVIRPTELKQRAAAGLNTGLNTLIKHDCKLLLVRGSKVF